MKKGCPLHKRSGSIYKIGPAESFLKILYLILFMILLPALSFGESINSKKTRGVESYNENKYDEALKNFTDALVEDPKNANLKYNLANTYYNLQNYQDAAQSYLDSTAATDDRELKEKSYYNLGNISYKQGLLEDAIEYYKKALELAPDDQDAKFNLEFVKKELKKREQQNQDQQQSKEGKEKQEQEKDSQEEQKQDKQSQEQQQGKEEGKEKGEQEEQKKAGSQEEQKNKEQESGASQQAGKEGDQSQAMQKGREMTEEETEMWLDALKENRSQFMKKQMEHQERGEYSGKDW